MSTKDLSFEEKVEDYRRRLGEAEAPLDLRGSSLSGGTFSSAGKTSEPLADERARVVLLPSRSRAFSPVKYSRNVQSADSTLIEESLSPSSLIHATSPRFVEDTQPPFVSDYVAFGRDPQKESYSMYTEQGSAYGKMDEQVQRRNEVIAQMSKELESLTKDFREGQTRISSLELENADLHNRLQESVRTAKTAEARQRQLLRELEELKSQSGTGQELAEARKEVAVRVREMESVRSSLALLERELRQAKDSLASRTDECLSLKKERVRLLKDLDMCKQRETEQERDLRVLATETDKLGNELRSAQEQLTEKEESEERLRLENEALLAELRESPVEILRQRVAELELAVKRYKESPLAAKPRAGRKLSNPRHRSEDSKSPSVATQRKVLRDLQELLQLDSAAQLLSCVKGLLRKAKTLTAASEFIEKINAIVVQYSPPGAFVRPPSLKQVWKWVSRLIDEYMALRKLNDSHSSADRLLAELVTLLGVSHYSQLPRTIESLLHGPL
jgi:hypothetical protein